MWKKILYNLFVKSPLYKFKYPKLLLFAITIIFAYIMFSDPSMNLIITRLGDLSYLGSLIAGMLFAFGFTSPFAIGYFLLSTPPNIYIAALIGGFGAMISDLIIFKVIRFSFQEEINKLEKEWPIKMAAYFAEKTLGKKIMVYLSFAFAGFLIASPLPDEAGITLLSGLTKIKDWQLVITSFVLHTTALLAILWT